MWYQPPSTKTSGQPNEKFTLHVRREGNSLVMFGGQIADDRDGGGFLNCRGGEKGE